MWTLTRLAATVAVFLPLGAVRGEDPQVRLQLFRSSVADPEAKCRALVALQRDGPRTDPTLLKTVADLAESRDDPPAVRRTALRTLGTLGPGAVPALLRALDDPAVRESAVDAFRTLGPRAAAAVPDLLARVRTGDAERAGRSLVVLRIIGPRPDQFLPTAAGVVGRLSDSRASRREMVERVFQAEMAVRILGDMEPVPPDALPVLLAALAVDRAGVPRADDVTRPALAVLARLGPAAAAAAPRLGTFRGDPILGEAAALALGRVTAPPPGGARPFEAVVPESAGRPAGRAFGTRINGRVEGPVWTVGPGGRVVQRDTFDGGVLHGPRTVYYPSGQVYREETYVRGVEAGERREYYPDGGRRGAFEVVGGEPHGTFTLYSPDGTVAVRGSADRGRYQGDRWHYRPDGSVIGVSEWRDGRRMGPWPPAAWAAADRDAQAAVDRFPATMHEVWRGVK